MRNIYIALRMSDFDIDFFCEEKKRHVKVMYTKENYFKIEAHMRFVYCDWLFCAVAATQQLSFFLLLNIFVFFSEMKNFV